MRALLFLTAMAGVAPLAAQSAGSPALLRTADSIVQAFQRQSKAPGVAAGIVQNGAVVYAKGFGTARPGLPATVRTVYHMASVSKPFAATAIVQLVEAGKIDLGAPVTRYLPDFKMKDPKYTAITIRELLNHTAGMPDVTDYHWDKPEYDAGSLERWVRTLADSSLLFAPGTRMEYSNIGFEVLADVVAKVSGEPFEDYVQRHILTPAGMRHSTLLMTDVDSANLAAGHSETKAGAIGTNQVYPYNRRHAASSTLHSNVDDMLRWARINLAKGELDGQRILKPESYGLLWTPTFDNTDGMRRRYARAGVQMPYESFKVGLSWFVVGYHGMTLINHSGGDTGFRTDLFLVPSANAAVVVMANYDRANVHELALALLALAVKK